MIATFLLAASLTPPASLAFQPRDVGEMPTHKSKQSEEVRIGALGGVGFPRPLGVEAIMKIGGVFAIGAEYSALPQTSVSGVNVHLTAWAADARVFPLAGPFFFGARFGRQHVSTDATVSYAARSYSGSIATDTMFVNPRLGFLWTWSSGITLGMDAGLQIPLSHSTSSNVPSGISLPEGAKTTTDYLGTKIIPTVTLLQLGFLL